MKNGCLTVENIVREDDGNESFDVGIDKNKTIQKGETK